MGTMLIAGLTAAAQLNGGTTLGRSSGRDLDELAGAATVASVTSPDRHCLFHLPAGLGDRTLDENCRGAAGPEMTGRSTTIGCCSR